MWNLFNHSNSRENKNTIEPHIITIKAQETKLQNGSKNLPNDIRALFNQKNEFAVDDGAIFSEQEPLLDGELNLKPCQQLVTEMVS